MVTINSALQAYNNAAGNIAPASSQSSGKGGQFADMLNGFIDNTMGSIKKSESLSRDAIMGKPDLPNLVTAINEAEMTLQTMVNVRDRVITAYQEIMRMPI